MAREITKLFIKRERIRRNLTNQMPICLSPEDAETLALWIKELENKIKLLEADKKCK